MGLADEVQLFVERTKRARSLPEIHALLDEMVRELGFAYFALLQYLAADQAAPIQLANLPTSWLETMLKGQFLSEDPVLVAAQGSVAPFAWSDLPTLVRLTPRQMAILTEAGAHGMGEGFTVPLHAPGAPLGLCSFSTLPAKPLPTATLPVAQYIACFAFEAARRLAQRRSAPTTPRLTQRQLECLVLLARGKSESVAGQLLGLSPRTVHKYMEHAKERFGVASRSQLIVRALFDGELTYADIL